MRKLIYILPTLFLMLIAVACQDTEQEEDGYGYLQLSSIDIDKNVVPKGAEANGRAAVERTEEPKIGLDILKGTTVVKTVKDWRLIETQSIKLEVGEYVLRAYSSELNPDNQGVDAGPYYKGESKVTIAKGKVQTAKVTCSLAQSIVTINYSAKFKEAYSVYYSAELKNEFGSAVVASNETRSAYMRSGKKIEIALTCEGAVGGRQTFEQDLVAEAKERYHYIVNYDVTDQGKGNVVIDIDPLTKEHHLTITVPMKPAPTSEVATGSSNAWGKFAYIYGTAALVDGETEPVVFKYRKKGDTNWIEVASKLEGTTYEGKTNEIDFDTTYEYTIACGTVIGNVATFTTEKLRVLENMSLDDWTSKKLSKLCWFPSAKDSNTFWATGNKGVSDIPILVWKSKDSNTVPVEGADAYKGKAAKMTTIDIYAAGVAAGNLFIGDFETVMTNPSASPKFGREYSNARPTKLSGYYKYAPSPLNYGSFPDDLTEDQAHIYIQLWGEDGEQIGYGEFVESNTVSSYTKFEINVEYNDLITKPAKMTIVATSSRYGGVFNGLAVIGKVGKGSTLWVDEFELSYYK